MLLRSLLAVVTVPCFLHNLAGFRGTTTGALKLDAQVHSIDTQECGTSLVCLRNPYDCTSTSSCITFITSRYNSSTGKITFQIATAQEYVAFGQNTKTSNLMSKIRGQYCLKRSGGGVSFGNFHGNFLGGIGRPHYQDTVSGVEYSVNTIIGNSVICQYERSAETPVSQTLLYNLNDPLTGVVAHGSGGATPGYHGSDGTDWTSFRVVFTDLVSFGTEPVLADSCNGANECILDPPGCISSYDCNFIAKYKYDSSNNYIEVEISTRRNFAAFGQTLSSTDNDTRGEICYKENNVAKLRSFRFRPGIPVDYHATKVDGITTVKTYVIPYALKESVVCKYRRTVSAPPASTNYMFDITEPRRFASVSGDTITSGDPVFELNDVTYSTSTIAIVPVQIQTTSVISSDETYSTNTISIVPVISSLAATASFHDPMYPSSPGNNEINTTIASDVTTATIMDTPVIMTTIIKDSSVLNNSEVMATVITSTPAISTVHPSTPSYIKITPSNEVSSATAQVPVAEMSVSNTISPKPSMTSSVMFQTPTLPTGSTINIAKCGKNCIRKPVDCTPLSSCDAVATYEYIKSRDKVVIKLATKWQYVAFAQKKDARTMANMRGQYCGKPSQFGSFHCNNLRGNGRPTFLSSPIDDVKFIRAHVDTSGILECSFERSVKPSAVNSDYLYDMDEELYAFLAYGQIPSSNPGYHGRPNTFVSSTKVNFLEVREIHGESHLLTTKEKAHGVLMIIAYVLVATSGILASRYMKGLAKDAWFNSHLIIMVLCVTLSISAFVIIVVETGGWAEHAGKHHFTGLFAVVAILTQPVMAVLRPAPDGKWRSIFNWAHRTVGMLGWLLGGLAVVFIFDHYDKNSGVPIAFIVVTILLCVTLEITMGFFEKQVGPSEAESPTSVPPLNSNYELDEMSAERTAEVTTARESNKMDKHVLKGFLLFIFTFGLIIAVYLAVVVCTWR